jgi:hypothetical protein
VNLPNRLQTSDPLVDSDVRSESQLEPPFIVYIHNNVNTIPEQNRYLLGLVGTQLRNVSNFDSVQLKHSTFHRGDFLGGMTPKGHLYTEGRD